MSLAEEELSDRIRLLTARLAMVEKRMFGGRAFMLNGNMLVCPTKEGGLMVRVGKEGMDEALSRPGAEPMQMKGRAVSGFIYVTGDAIEDDDELGGWLDRALHFVQTLPAK